MKFWEGLGFVLVLFSRLSLLLGAPDDFPIVETRTGLVRGKWASSSSGRKYAEFKGIPYAKPPIGLLRLLDPEPAERWEGVRDAFEFSSVCIQKIQVPVLETEVLGNEDCLYLNVYSHNLTGKSPVLVHIHGGGFVGGNGNKSPAYLMNEDLVIVSINYRLNVFGFFSLEREELRGNQGLKDQVQALRWVQANIAAFGGDPDLVTINGESAGGASVHLQLMSPLSKGLFHRVIAESGSAFAPWAVSFPGLAKEQAEDILEALGCPKTPKEALTCVQGMDSKDIANVFFNTAAQLSGEEGLIDRRGEGEEVTRDRWWGEVHEMEGKAILGITSFLVSKEFPIANAPGGLVALEPPGEAAFLTGPISEWKPHPVPLVLSTTSAEGLLITLVLLISGISLDEISAEFDQAAAGLMLYKDTAPEPDKITQQVKDFYLSGGEITMKEWVNFTTMFTDDLFVVPILDAANRHTADVYLYYFDYISQSMPSNPLIFGAMHCAEQEFIWGENQKFGEKELELSKNLVNMMANFAKTGVPSGLPQEWKKWTKTEKYYMELNRNTEFNLKTGLAEDRYNFWKSLDYRSKIDP